MPPRRKGSPPWPFGRKLTAWLSDHGTSLNAFARRHGIPQQSLHGWVKLGRRVPADVVEKVAAATRLPAGYWLNGALPYPPALQYANLAEVVLEALKALPLEQLTEIHAMLGDPEDLRRTLALRRAVREHPK